MEFYDKFVDRFQVISKVKNPAVSKAKSSNYLEPSKGNVLREYDAVTLTMRYFMILFHKILKLIFQTHQSCHRNICTEH